MSNITATYDRDAHTESFVVKMNDILSHFPEGYVSGSLSINQGNKAKKDDRSVWFHGSLTGSKININGYVAEIKVDGEHLSSFWLSTYVDGESVQLGDLARFKDAELHVKLLRTIIEHYEPHLRQDPLAGIEGVSTEYGVHVTGYPKILADWEKITDGPEDEWKWVDTEEERDEIARYHEDVGFDVSYHHRLVGQPVDDESEEL